MRTAVVIAGFALLGLAMYMLLQNVKNDYEMPVKV